MKKALKKIKRRIWKTCWQPRRRIVTATNRKHLSPRFTIESFLLRFFKFPFHGRSHVALTTTKYNTLYLSSYHQLNIYSGDYKRI